MAQTFIKERTKEKATPFPLDSACAEPL